MPTHVTRKPVLVWSNATPEEEKRHHIRHFIETNPLATLMSLSTEDKHRWFQIQTDMEDIVAKVYGENMTHYMGPAMLLPKAAREGVDHPFVNEYRQWLNGENT